MATRNLSPQRMFIEMALEHRPTHAFGEGDRKDFTAWKADTLPKVKACLGDWPSKVPAKPELSCEWSHDGLVKQRWFIDVGKHISAVLIICKPSGLQPGERRPAIPCWHGHGPDGKTPVIGDDSTLALRAQIQQHNYNYAHQMAKQGFITYAIDWIGCGERNDNRKPNHLNTNGERDWCNLYYLHATMLGMTSLSINLAHGMAATDFVCGLPDVDASKLGVMGLSGGGTMTLWSYLTDERFKAGEIICYSDLWQHFGFRDINYCGMQVAPGLFKLVNLPDLQGLLAPKPLLIDIGAYDKCFLVDTATQCFNKLKSIYQAAGADDNVELDLFPGEHGWGGNKALAFFAKHLRG